MVLLALFTATAGAQPPGRPGPYGRPVDKQGRGPDHQQQQFRHDPGDRRMTQDERREMRRQLDQANEEIYKRKR
jgi:hypothetical protein